MTSSIVKRLQPSLDYNSLPFASFFLRLKKSFANRSGGYFESTCHKRNFLIILELLLLTLRLSTRRPSQGGRSFLGTGTSVHSLKIKNSKIQSENFSLQDSTPHLGTHQSVILFVSQNSYCDSLAWLRHIFSYRACKNSFLLEKSSRVVVATFIELEFHERGHYHHSRTFFVDAKIHEVFRIANKSDSD